ncbi:MAG: HAD family hydrolase, partial [Rhizobiales bacterium]|nr:HAD family hydrolase [Hyphomicrobiales bacterium]
DGPERAMMVGNSLRSDIVPAIRAGSWAVYVPHALSWALEHDEEPVDAPRYRHIDDLGGLLPLIREIDPETR